MGKLTSTMRISDEFGLEYRCCKCEEFFPADLEFFYKSSNGSGLASWCKACLEADPKRIARKNRWREKDKQMRALKRKLSQ